MLRCPTCLNRLESGGEKRCPACGARIRTGRRANLVTDDAVFKRPRALVERELQARIEAQTAPRFLQRRRAARTARRIAALPSSVFENSVRVDPDTGVWSVRPPAPAVIDIPVTSIHDTPHAGELAAASEDVAPPTRRRWRPWRAASNGHDAERAEEPVVEKIAEPVAEPLVETVSEPVSSPWLFVTGRESADGVEAPAPTRRLASRAGDRWRAWRSPRAVEEDDGVVATEAAFAAAEREQTVEPPAEAPVAPGGVPDAEPVALPDDAPSPSRGFAARLADRRRAWHASRAAHVPDEGVETAADAIDQHDVDEGPADGPRGERAPLFGDRWRTWKSVPHDDDAPVRNGNATDDAVAAAPPPPPPPRPDRRGTRPEPREAAPAALAPRGAENWQPSTSLWANLVFSNSRNTQIASWPRHRPEPSEVGESAPAE